MSETSGGRILNPDQLLNSNRPPKKKPDTLKMEKNWLDLGALLKCMRHGPTMMFFDGSFLKRVKIYDI